LDQRGGIGIGRGLAPVADSLRLPPMLLLFDPSLKCFGAI
jgi:hypothetical protein